MAAADEGIAECRRRTRPKYEALGQVTRAQALSRLHRQADAIAAAGEAGRIARAIEDPALVLRAVDTLLQLEGDDATAQEAKTTCAGIRAALSYETIRRRFDQSGIASRVSARAGLADGTGEVAGSGAHHRFEQPMTRRTLVRCGVAMMMFGLAATIQVTSARQAASVPYPTQDPFVGGGEDFARGPASGQLRHPRRLPSLLRQRQGDGGLPHLPFPRGVDSHRFLECKVLLRRRRRA